jgi:hypothetical protein
MGKTNRTKAFVWISLLTVLILMIPAVGMTLTDAVDWTLPDFVVMGLLVFSTGCLIVIAASNWKGWRLVLCVALLIGAFIYFWAELGVGIFFDFGS